jgi:ABC-2 type transport system permease protein
MAPDMAWPKDSFLQPPKRDTIPPGNLFRSAPFEATPRAALDSLRRGMQHRGMASWSVLRKCGKTAAMTAAGYVGDSPLFLLDYLVRFLRVALLLSIWRMILAGKGVVSGMTVSSVLTYTLIAELFAEPLACRTELDHTLWNGSIATRMLQPLGLVAHFASEAFGRWLFGFGAFSLPLLLLAPLLGVDPLPASAGAAAWFPLSLALAISVGLALEFIFGALMVSLELPMWAVQQLRTGVSTLLSGALIPLALLPWGIGKIFGWLPFASMASAPLRIYTGTGDPFVLIAVQAGWSLLLWPAALGLWRASRERLTSYGG